MIVVWLMPWRAARRIRSQEKAILRLTDAVVAVHRQQQPGQRHLRLVK